MQSADSQQSQSSSPQHLRVFLASPGDVADERGLAIKVIDDLQYAPGLTGKIATHTVAWDKPAEGTPMLATMTPQEAIIAQLPKPSECDFVVVILWSRIGTPLPPEWVKPDGSRYLSGTEWECLEAMEAAERYGKPEVLIYYRTEEPQIGLGDPELDNKRDQFTKVKVFLKSFDNPDGSIRGGLTPYETPDSFKHKLEKHLQTCIFRLLEPRQITSEDLEQPQVPVWQGSPFPGLRAFTPADAPIFFGRGRETDGLVSKLGDPAVRFLAVVGASGSGKSSLVAAGLIPRLMAGAMLGSQNWVWIRFTPGEAGDNPFMALSLSFKDALQQRGQSPRALAEKLGQQLATLTELRDLALADKPVWAELLLFLDQFEELFTLAAPRHVEPFIDLLTQAAHNERIRVVVTLRADFYHRCLEWPALAELLRTGSYPLAVPGPGALHEMITRPAERAGLIFEAGLVEQMLDDTSSEPGALALLAFALAELYVAKTAGGTLTQAAYDQFGGVKEVIGQRAEDVVHRLGVALEAVGEVFQELVEIEEGKAVTRRRTPWARLVKSRETERLVTAFIDARLLVASRGEDGQAVVEVAHEALFHEWKRLRRWLDDKRELLRWYQRLRVAADNWKRIGHDEDALLRGTLLIEAWNHLLTHPQHCSTADEGFIRASCLHSAIKILSNSEEGKLSGGWVWAVVLGFFVYGFVEKSAFVTSVLGENGSIQWLISLAAGAIVAGGIGGVFTAQTIDRIKPTGGLSLIGVASVAAGWAAALFVPLLVGTLVFWASGGELPTPIMACLLGATISGAFGGWVTGQAIKRIEPMTVVPQVVVGWAIAWLVSLPIALFAAWLFDAIAHVILGPLASSILNALDTSVRDNALVTKLQSFLKNPDNYDIYIKLGAMIMFLSVSAGTIGSLGIKATIRSLRRSMKKWKKLSN